MHSYYRGVVYTNEEIKGPFTEAMDDFKKAFKLLQRCAEGKAGLDVECLQGGPDGPLVLFKVADMRLCISENGLVELVGGAG